MLLLYRSSLLEIDQHVRRIAASGVRSSRYRVRRVRLTGSAVDTAGYSLTHQRAQYVLDLVEPLDRNQSRDRGVALVWRPRDDLLDFLDIHFVLVIFGHMIIVLEFLIRWMRLRALGSSYLNGSP